MRGRNRGGQKRGRTQRRHFRDGREDAWKKPRPDSSLEAAPNSGWEPFVKESPMFEQYYKKQCIVQEDEWNEFLATLRKALPAVFRINSSGLFSAAIRDQIENDFMTSLKDEPEVECEAAELVKPLTWYPDKLAWQLNFSRMQLRKNQTLARIHAFLKQENEIGSITRQEAVSMLPPLFLDVRPHHQILDMCAAPGSKTFQLLEMIHGGGKIGLLPKGLVIANDLDVQRCHLLVHQTKRMCSSNVIVTNHEAQHFPGLRKEGDSARDILGSDSSLQIFTEEKAMEDLRCPVDKEVTRIEVEDKGLSFDRVLCDVPCSGDGTIRKAPDIWRKWNAGIANGLHRLQVQIAMRGVALLKVGGRLVYSTCSLNPIEDEAVVAEVLRRSGGCMELLDVSNELKDLKRRPGLKTWKVRDKGRWISSYDQVNKHRAGSIVPGMFPSGKGADGNAEFEDQNTEHVEGQHASEGDFVKESTENLKVGEKERNEGDMEEVEGEMATLPLERCMRILPHDQDTGGFFVAVFQKTSPFKVYQHTIKEADTKRGCAMMEKPAKVVAKLPAGDAMDDASRNTEKGSCEPSEVVNMLQRVEAEMIGDQSFDCVSEEKPQSDPLNGVPVWKDGKSEQEIHNPETTYLDYPNESTIAHKNEENREKEVIEDCDKNKATGQRLRGRIQQQGSYRGVDPVLFLKDDGIINSLVDFYGIKETLPLRGHLVTRSGDTGHLKRIYYVSQSVRDVIQLNFRAGEQLKIASVGLKVFERQAGREGFSPCAFRISSEGLPLLLPHLTKQIIYASRMDFKLLLSSKAVPFTSFHDSSFATAAQALLPGCCIVILTGESNCDALKFAAPIAIGCWRGRATMSLLISKVEAAQLLERSFMEEDKSQLPEDGISEPLKDSEMVDSAIEEIGNGTEDLQHGSESSSLSGEPQEADNTSVDVNDPRP